MVSSILTNGRNWGQEKSPGFVITNAFGNVLVSYLQLHADVILFVIRTRISKYVATICSHRSCIFLPFALCFTKDEKLVAENYLKQSGIDYTIVRPGGLKAKPPTGALQISGEDTLNSGEISRDLVADVCVASLADAKAKNKVLGEYFLYEYLLELSVA